MPESQTNHNLFTLLRRLERTHARALPVNRIAEELGVHRRTVIRWLQTLESEWLDGDDNPVVRREHRSGEAWAVLSAPTSALSANIFQYAATAAATKHLEAGGGSLLSESAADVLDRVEAGMPSTVRDYIPRVTQSFHYVPFAPKDHRASEETLDALVRALIRRHPIDVDYTNTSGVQSNKHLRPYTLVMYRDGFYLLAQVDGVERLRLYAVERMGEVHIRRDQTFAIPEDYDPSEEFGRNLGVWRTDAPEVRVRIAFGPSAEAVLSSRRWPGFSSLTPHVDGRLILELEVPITPEIKSWVLGWGSVAEVLEPAELRSLVASETAAAARLYDVEPD